MKLNFWSVDSFAGGMTLPVHYARPFGVYCAFLATFALLYLALERITFSYPIFFHGDLIIFNYLHERVIPIRLTMLSAFASFSIFCAGTPLVKLRFFTHLVSRFLFICISADLFCYLVNVFAGLVVDLTTVQILCAFSGFWLFSIAIVDFGKMPKSKLIFSNLATFPTKLAIVAFLLLTLMVVQWLSSELLFYIDGMRKYYLMGGLLPGIPLFIPIFLFILYFWGRFRVMRMKKRNLPGIDKTQAQDINVLIPAHNEAEEISYTLSAINKAAAHYPAKVIVLIAENNSTDNTYDVCTRSQSDFPNVVIKVIQEKTAGKAHALNTGLSHIDTEFFIRIDADTLIGEDTFVKCIPYMNMENLGVLGGAAQGARFMDV